MDDKILKHIQEYHNKSGWSFDGTPADIFETLNSVPIIYAKVINSHRWWNDVFCVVELDDMLIGYNGAETTGDNSPLDVGWKFDLETVVEVEKHTETKMITTYKRVNE